MSENTGIEILDEFEGSMMGKHRIEGDKILIDLRKEKITRGYLEDHDYNLHFHFGIRNNSGEDRKLHVYVDCSTEEDLKVGLSWIWRSSRRDRPYDIEEIEGRTNLANPIKYFFPLVVKGGEEVYIANFPPIEYEDLVRRFDELVKDSKGEKKEIGRTVEGRDIIAYEYGDTSGKPVLMFVSGFHPPERDTFAIEKIMTKLKDEGFLSGILRNFSLTFIPILNPDGFANYMQGSNMKEINFHWKFFGNTQEECPESHAIWNYCEKIEPLFLIDFHAFTFQPWSARPYIVPTSYQNNGILKKIQMEINDELVKICDNNHSLSGKILAPNLMASRLMRDHGTVISPKFHLHMKDGPEKCEELSLRIFDTITGIFEKHLKSGKGLKRSKRGPLNRSKITMLDLYYLKIRPNLFKLLIKVKK